MLTFEQCGYTPIPIIGVPYQACWLELELDREHVAAPPSCHQPGPTHRDVPPLPCLPTAPGRSGPCCIRAGLLCLPKHQHWPDHATVH